MQMCVNDQALALITGCWGTPSSITQVPDVFTYTLPTAALLFTLFHTADGRFYLKFVSNPPFPLEPPLDWVFLVLLVRSPYGGLFY